MADWVGRIVAPAVVYVSSLKEAFSPAVFVLYICFVVVWLFDVLYNLSIVIYIVYNMKS